jgi:glycosyltransferase involved in cell wall biosynthesis
MDQEAPTRLRLLFVHERFGPFAGAEANILATAAELKHRGHTVAIVHGPSTGKANDTWEETFPQRFPLRRDDNASRVRAALERFQPDVVYVHKMADLEVIETLVASGVPQARMVHDHDLYCMRSYKYNFFTRRICARPASPFCVLPCGAVVARNHEGRFPLKFVSYPAKVRELELNRNFHRMIVATQFMKEELLRNGFDPEKIEIHPPVPRPGDASLRSAFGARNVVVYAGQVIRGKGVDVLIESLAQVRVPFECFIFGDGNHRAFCEKLAHKLGLAGRVHFKGYVPPEEIGIHYRDCSVVAVSSVWPEPFGAVGLEGMRYGLPVVAFDAGGIKEWLIDGYNGYLVPWMDRAAFAARVEQLLRDKRHARQLGEQGRTMVAEFYGFTNYLNRLEELFARVAKQARQPITA